MSHTLNTALPNKACCKRNKKTAPLCTEVEKSVTRLHPEEIFETPEVSPGFVGALYLGATQALYDHLKVSDPAAFEVFRLLGALEVCQREMDEHDGQISQDMGRGLGQTVLQLIHALNFNRAVIEYVSLEVANGKPH